MFGRSWCRVRPPSRCEPSRSSSPDARHHETANLIVVRPSPKRDGTVAVVSAGTSDLPVAEEAAVTAEAFGLSVERITDVGVAGVHRLLERVPTLAQMDSVIVVAGMEGALPSVVAGLVPAPVIAVPTRGLRRDIRWPRSASRHAQLLRPRDRRGQHRQRLGGGDGGPSHDPAMRVAYFDCRPGISGGAALAALLDAGADVADLADRLDVLGEMVPGSGSRMRWSASFAPGRSRSTAAASRWDADSATWKR